MVHLRKYLLLLLLLMPAFFLTAQEENTSRLIEAIMEAHLENEEEGANVELILEDLEDLAENPVNINHTNARELKRLYVLNDIQIEKLLSYVAEFGPVYTIYELSTVDGFTADLLEKISPFVRFDVSATEAQKLGDALKYADHQALFRVLQTVPKARGYKPSDDGSAPYEGNPMRIYTRYRIQAGESLSAGITAEKDPGEAFFRGANKNGFDFYSAHLSMRVNKYIPRVTVGDFMVRAGQGLVLWQGYTSGKSVYTLNVAKTAQEIRPYTSVDENSFFRGATAGFSAGNASMEIFWSRKKSDANIISTEEDGLHFTSLQSSGYHRTTSEIADKNSVRHSNLGAVASYRFTHLKVAAVFLSDEFELPFIPAAQPYNHFRFRGKTNQAGGVNYMYNRGKYELFGEAALSKSGGKAVLQGAVARLNDQVNFSFLFRHFDKNYQSLWGNAFSEGSSVANESGMYFGTRILPVKFVTLSAYSDYYRSGWINYTTTAPSSGWDAFVQADVVFSRKVEFYIRYKNEEKERKTTHDGRYVNVAETTRKTRVHLQYHPTETIRLKTRVEHAGYQRDEKENGFMVFQDVQWKPENRPFDLSARLAWFATDSYYTRIYAYENDLLYTFSIPAYYGKGIRAYVNLKYQISNKLDFWMKVGRTSWNDRETISSGYNVIEGKHKTELKFQLRLKI